MSTKFAYLSSESSFFEQSLDFLFDYYSKISFSGKICYFLTDFFSKILSFLEFYDLLTDFYSKILSFLEFRDFLADFCLRFYLDFYKTGEYSLWGFLSDKWTDFEREFLLKFDDLWDFSGVFIERFDVIFSLSGDNYENSLTSSCISPTTSF